MQEQQSKAKITVEFPDGEVVTYESATIAVVATEENGTHVLVYTKAPLTESLRLLNGLDNAKRKVLGSHPLLSYFRKELESYGEEVEEEEETAFKKGGGVN